MARQLDKHEKDELAAMVQRTSLHSVLKALADYLETSVADRAFDGANGIVSVTRGRADYLRKLCRDIYPFNIEP